MADHALKQTNGWDPLDLGGPRATRRRDLDSGSGILRDTDTRPEIRPVTRPTSRAAAPQHPPSDAPWDQR